MSNKKEDLKKKMNQDPFFIEFSNLMKKYNIPTYYLYGKNKDCFYERLEFSQMDMTKLVSRILFEKKGYDFVRDIIMSDVLRYLDPMRTTRKKNNKGKFVSVPFIPSIYECDGEDEDE